MTPTTYLFFFTIISFLSPSVSAVAICRLCAPLLCVFSFWRHFGRQVKCMEDVMVQYDASVRNALGEIIQFVYGEDGMDGWSDGNKTQRQQWLCARLAGGGRRRFVHSFCLFLPLSLFCFPFSFIEKQKLDSAKMDDDKLRSVYGIDLSHPESLDSWLALDVKEKLLRDPEAHAKLQSEFDGIMEDRDMLRARVLKIGDDGWSEEHAQERIGRGSARLRPCRRICLISFLFLVLLSFSSVFSYLPVNMKRLIWNAQKRFRTTPTLMAAGGLTSRSTLSPLHVIDSLQNLCSRLVVIRGGDSLSREAQSNATLLFKTMLRSTFASKRVIKDYNLSKDAFNCQSHTTALRVDDLCQLNNSSHLCRRVLLPICAVQGCSVRWRLVSTRRWLTPVK